MFETLFNNLALVGMLTVMYLGSVVLNTLLGVYNNISQLKDEFSKEKLINGLVKSGIALIGSLGITLFITLLPQILTYFGIAADSVVIESISVAAIAGVMGSSILKYLSDALKKFYTILGYVKEKEEE